MSRPGSVSNRRQPALGHRAKRWLFITHRWIGIATCLLFAIWFVSGLVMIYVPFPSLTAEERAVGLEPIAWASVDVQPARALAQARIAAPKLLILEMRDGSPVWRIDPWEGAQETIAASSENPVQPVDAALARRVASAFGRAPVQNVERIERDQWSVAGSFDRHRPLWKAELADEAGTALYVSSKTGAVVLDTHRAERFWNWLGSVPHWIYPTILRQDGPAWRQVVLWVSGPCIAAAVTGVWIGILRTRIGKRRFSGGRMIPYRGWMWWHHVAGLTGGVALLAWIFSGWLSVDPGRLFASEGITASAMSAYANASAPQPIAFDRLARLAPMAKRVELRWAAGEAVLTVRQEGSPPVSLNGATLAPIHFDRALILEAANRLVPGAHIVEVSRLDAPDAYWYEVGSLPRLPVLRIKFNDPAKTWAHIDPETGQLLGDLDTRRRVYRWLFDLLHKWDVNGLTLNRPVWDILLWLLSLLGLVTSVSGIWIGVRALRRSNRRRASAP
jgi:hypothetical protein